MRGKNNTPLGKRDINKIDMRREYVATLLASGVTRPSDIIKRIRADSQAAFLIDGYESVYKLITNDVTAVKRGYRKRGDNSVVTIAARGALAEYAARQDQIYDGAWETIHRKMENEDLDGKELSALFATASEAAESKARALGVDTERASTARMESSDHGRPLIENAIIAANPTDLMAAFEVQSKLASGAPPGAADITTPPDTTDALDIPADTIDVPSIDITADPGAPAMSRGDLEAAAVDAQVREEYEEGNPLVQVMPKDE